MNHTVAYEAGLGRFSPLSTILCYDDFDRGLCGWLDLKPNFRYENFTYHPGPVDLGRSCPLGTHHAQHGHLRLSRYPWINERHLLSEGLQPSQCRTV